MMVYVYPIKLYEKKPMIPIEIPTGGWAQVRPWDFVLASG